jgi:hypothetical protein
MRANFLLLCGVGREEGNGTFFDSPNPKGEVEVMRHLWMGTGVLGLALAGLLGFCPSSTRAADLLDEKPACKAHGTTIDFVDTPSEAARLAKKAGKLVLILHVSGNFEDPNFT